MLGEISDNLSHGAESPMTVSIRALKHWLKPLARTPLHPQWLVIRGGAGTKLWLQQHAGGTVLDIGCGDSRIRDALPDNARYFGLDYPTTIALGYDGKPDILADASRLPIAEACVDTVLLLDVLEHFTQPEQAIAEASRVLRPGGKCLILMPFLYPLHDEPHDYQRWTRHGLRRVLEKHGFRIVEIKETSSPCTTAAALYSMALAKGVLDALHRKSPVVLLVALLLAVIPLVNLSGWFTGKIMPQSGIMPSSYRVVASLKSKPGASS